jgi:hypothetical protein
LLAHVGPFTPSLAGVFPAHPARGVTL